MEEKVLIKSEQYNVKKLFKNLICLGLLLSILTFACVFCRYISMYDWDYEEEYLEHQRDGCPANAKGVFSEGAKCWDCYDYEGGAFAFAVDRLFKKDKIPVPLCLIPFGSFVLIGVIFYFWLRSYELTVTDKRIYGKVAWGKRVDLPVDSVSATETGRWKSVAVSTSSGRIAFLLIKNADEIYTVMSNLLIERQQEKSKTTVVAPAAPAASNADELKKYKELLDQGIITQEEFDAKKKQLLGL